MRITFLRLTLLALLLLAGGSTASAQSADCYCAECDLTVTCAGSCGCALTCHLNPDGTCSFRVWCFLCIDSVTPQVAAGKLENVPLGEAVALLARRGRLDVRIVGDPSQLVSISFAGEPVTSVLERLSQQTGTLVEARPATSWDGSFPAELGSCNGARKVT